VPAPISDPRSAPPVAPTLRRATPADVARLTAFAARAFRETYASICRTEDVEAHVAEHLTTDAVDATLADPAITVTIAELADGAGATGIAGYVQLRAGGMPGSAARLDPALFPPGARTLEVARLYVDPAYHGRGVAHTLMAHARAEAAGAGALLWLSAFTRSPRAIAFYRKIGMTPAGTQTFIMGEDAQEDWVMVDPLAGA